MMMKQNDSNPSRALPRRGFLKRAGLLAACAPFAGLEGCPGQKQPGIRPNILWITCEDISPHLGCYGDPYAHTPHLDTLAAEGVRYDKAFAPAPLCTPARSTLISGLYACSLGTHNLRGTMPLSPKIRPFTQYLREAGYYCSNNEKEDYNFDTPPGTWDESSGTAHWRKRAPGQPFFSVFNFMLTHQSQTRYDPVELKKRNAALPAEARHDPGDAPVPPYYPDTPAVRANLAALHTQITLMDLKVRELLDQLEQDGLSRETIVFFYSDHGDGLPRGKRWLFDSGLRVPLIIRFPEKYASLSPGKPGSVCQDLVSFVDFAPTVLSLIGLPVPQAMQGRPFLGGAKQKPRGHVFAMRDRVDEVLEVSRSVRDRRYLYIRNFFPHRGRMQRSFYSELTPIRIQIRRLDRQDRLAGAAAWLAAAEKPAEELYDTDTDPFQIENLAADPAHRSRLERMRDVLYDWMLEIGDTGLVPEAELVRRAAGRSPYDVVRDDAAFPLDKILETADRVGRGPSHLPALRTALTDPEPGVRYWAATALAALGSSAAAAAGELRMALNDPSANVRFPAAEALARIGDSAEAVAVLARGLEHEDVRVRLAAAQVLVALGDISRPATPRIRTAIHQAEGQIDHGWYLREALSALIAEWDG